MCGLCACVGASALLCLSCLFTLQGSGEYRALLDPVTVSSLHPKPGPYASFVLPHSPLPPLSPYISAGFGFFNPGFQSHFNLSLLLSEIYGRLNAAIFLKPGCSLTLLLGPISAPEGLLNCPRSSVRKRERRRDRRRRKGGLAVTMLVLIKLVRNEFPVSKHTQ